MGIGSFGFSEMLVIVVLVLIFFGPQRMPEIARGLGKAMREFRKSMNEVKRELEQAGMADESQASKEDAEPRPSGTIEPPHVTAGAPPAGGLEPEAGTPVTAEAETGAEPVATGATAGEPTADPGQPSTAVDDSPPPATPVDEPAAAAGTPTREPEQAPAPSDPPA